MHETGNIGTDIDPNHRDSLVYQFFRLLENPIEEAEPSRQSVKLISGKIENRNIRKIELAIVQRLEKILGTSPTNDADPVTKALQEVEDEHEAELVEKKETKPNPIQFASSALVPRSDPLPIRKKLAA